MKNAKTGNPDVRRSSVWSCGGGLPWSVGIDVQAAARPVLTDEKGNVAKGWTGFETVVDVPPGAYRLESTLFAGQKPFMHATHEFCVLQSPERAK